MQSNKSISAGKYVQQRKTGKLSATVWLPEKQGCTSHRGGVLKSPEEIPEEMGTPRDWRGMGILYFEIFTSISGC